MLCTLHMLFSCYGAVNYFTSCDSNITWVMHISPTAVVWIRIYNIENWNRDFIVTMYLLIVSVTYYWVVHTCILSCYMWSRFSDWLSVWNSTSQWLWIHYSLTFELQRLKMV